jgi:hypothetical protein
MSDDDTGHPEGVALEAVLDQGTAAMAEYLAGFGLEKAEDPDEFDALTDECHCDMCCCIAAQKLGLLWVRYVHEYDGHVHGICTLARRAAS